MFGLLLSVDEFLIPVALVLLLLSFWLRLLFGFLLANGLIFAFSPVSSVGLESLSVGFEVSVLLSVGFDVSVLLSVGAVFELLPPLLSLLLLLSDGLFGFSTGVTVIVRELEIVVPLKSLE